MNITTLIILLVVAAVFLFILFFRQTVGSRIVRIRMANEDLENILLKRVVLEGYQPDAEGLSRLINGKAREFDIKKSELLTESQLLDIMYTKIIESDLITPDLRGDLLKRLSPMLKIIEADQVKELSLSGK